MTVAIEWRAKVVSKLPEIARQLSIPLVEIAKMIIPLMGRRVKLGVSATGRFSAMGKNPPTGGKGLWWVAPGDPQPAGWLARPTSGDWAGWAGYASYRDWLSARGILGQPRNFDETGEMWDSLRYRVLAANNVRIAFYGKHMYRAPPMPVGGGTPQWQRRIGGEFFDGSARIKPANEGKRGKAKYYANSEIAWLASRAEASPMLMPTREEVGAVMTLYKRNMSAQLVSFSAEGGAVQKLAVRATKLEIRRTAMELGRR
jgi:hypothetical protein